MNIEISNEMAMELFDAYGEALTGEVDDINRLIDIVGALLVYIPDPRGERPARQVPAPAVERLVRKPRGKLTPHQREVYDAIVRVCHRHRSRWVEDRYIGSKGACDKLAEKGWIEVDIAYGPRGGERRSYRPKAEGES